jgi:uncharacterized protein with GYD domain
MAVFVLMTRLGPGPMQDLGGRRAMGTEWLKRVKQACPEVKFIAHYALLGQYDFMDIYDAPDIETAHRVSMLSRSAGAVTAESWPALPYDRFLQVIEGLH